MTETGLECKYKKLNKIVAIKAGYTVASVGRDCFQLQSPDTRKHYYPWRLSEEVAWQDAPNFLSRNERLNLVSVLLVGVDPYELFFNNLCKLVTSRLNTSHHYRVLYREEILTVANDDEVFQSAYEALIGENYESGV